MSSRRSRLLGLAVTALLGLALALPAAAAPPVDVELDLLSLNGPLVHPGQVSILAGETVVFRGPVPEDGLVRLQLSEPSLKIVFEGETLALAAGPDTPTELNVKFEEGEFLEAREHALLTGEPLRVVWAAGGRSLELVEQEWENPGALEKSGGPAPPPPSNDDCAGASPLAIGPPEGCLDTVFSMVDATADGNFGCDSVGTNTGVWFSFVAPPNGGILMDVDNSGEIAIFESSCPPMGAEVYCSLLSTATTEKVTGLTPGETYYMVFWEDGTPSSSPYTICASEVPPPPENDDCDGAIDIQLDTVVVGSTASATDDPEARAAGCGTSISDPSAGVWYRVQGTGTTMVAETFDFPGDYDTKLHVFCGDCEVLTCIDGDDDGGPSTASRVEWCSQAGAEYLILVHGFSSNSGDYQLRVTADDAPCRATVKCLPEGACCTCLDGFYCRLTTAGVCRAIGGKYRGDDTTCLIEQGGSFVDVSSDFPTLLPNLGVNSSTIFVPDSLGIVTAEVTVDITMDYVDETLIYLVSPAGTVVVLMNEPESAGTCTILDTPFLTTFADDGDQFSDCPDLTEGKRISPVSANGSPLSALGGEDSMGAWTLFVDDTVGSIASSGGNGLLNSWTLRLVEVPPVKVDNCLPANNGPGNGLDPQPSGDPKPNDIPGDEG